MGASFGSYVGLLVLAAIVLFVYFLPWIVAINNNHPHWAGIAIVNLLFGWTLLGWVIALVWAVTLPREPVVVNYDNGPVTHGGFTQADDYQSFAAWQQAQRESSAHRNDKRQYR